MMQTHAFDFEVPSVQPEAGGSVKVKLANAEGCSLLVQSSFAGADQRDCTIEIGMIEIPEPRVLNHKLLLEDHGLSRRDRLLLALRGLNSPAIWTKHADPQRDATR